MKYLFALASSAMLFACEGVTQGKAGLNTHMDSVSYAIGVDIGRNMKMQKLEINTEAVAAGMKAMLDGSNTLLTDEQCSSVMMAFQQQMMAKRDEEQRASAETNKKAGDDFLAANKTKPGVQTTASGLQYKVIKMGSGPKPTRDKTVSVHYRGTLIDGTEFDSSIKRGQPTEFGVGQVIRGWTEGLQLMPVGSKFEFYIPSELAYGENGAGGQIGPNATLIFEVELLAIK
jgi:FKBP-type peptidyl-prolyl cis-trans isomerase